MKLLVLSREDVRQLIQHCLSSELLANQAGVFQILSAASNNERTEKANPTAFEAPLRTAISLKKATTLFMPARMGEDVTCKLVGVPKNSNGLSASTAVLDGDTGSIKAIINSTALTALRNAAGSALATLAIQSLTRFHSSPRRVTLFGSGQQSLHHAAFFSSVYESRFICSSPLHLDFISRSGLSESVFNELHGLGVKSGNITSIQSKDRALVKESVSSADIIICCTPSLQPLFPSEWVKGGTHIVLIGSYKPSMQEIDVALVQRATGRILVDDQQACAKEAGDLIKANVDGAKCIALGTLLHEQAYANLAQGNLLQLPTTDQTKAILDKLNKRLGVESSGDITIFKSVGVGLQDVAITRLIAEKAAEYRVGQLVHF